MTAQTEFFDATVMPDTGFDASLLADLKGIVRRHADNKPRSLQRELGPSSVGHPCARNLASGLLQLDRVNPEGDPLPAYIGTAVHAALEDAVAEDNKRLGRERWLSERRVTIRPGLSGTCDLYDTDTKTVIDFKVPGTTKMTEYRKRGPSDIYRVQTHLYGAGYAREGCDVEHVGIWFLPRAGQLATSILWTEPFDQAVVDQALQRLDNIMVLINDLGIEDNLAMLDVIPKTPNNCQFCAWWSPRADGSNPLACKGDAQ